MASLLYTETFSFTIGLLVESLHEMLKQETLYFNTTKYIIDALQGSGAL